MLFTPTHTYFSFLCAHRICVSAGSVELIQHSGGAAREGNHPSPFQIAAAAGDSSSEGDMLRRLRSIGSAHQKPH